MILSSIKIQAAELRLYKVDHGEMGFIQQAP
jgi:hypothetical protein